METPSVGRSVHYHQKAGEAPRPAVISAVREDSVCDLHVFTTNAFHPVKLHESVSYSETGAADTWTWPPRVAPKEEPPAAEKEEPSAGGKHKKHG